jgi:mRNA-degrading endonuclease toxin of MazEF toxin-antitoxin module
MGDYGMNYGDIYLLDLNPVRGHEQGNKRPVIIISNDFYNAMSSNRIVIPITSSQKYASNPRWAKNPYVLPIPNGEKIFGFALADQPRTIDLESRKIKFMGKLPEPLLYRLAESVKMGIGD